MADVGSSARVGRLDSELLRAFFEEGSEEAFGELVGRHVKGVYAHARRVLGDRHLAEDVTQAVFLLLAQKGGGIPERAAVVGWLYKVTQFACANAKRVEARRVRHERKAASMKEVAREEVGLSEEEVHVDRIVGGLRARERDALLMKYVEGRTVTEIGRVMGCSAAAAEKRVQRALEKVRERFAALGIQSPAGMKAAEMLGAGMVPAALSGMAVRGALSGAASPAVVHLAKGTSMSMFAAKVKVMAAVFVVVLTVGIGGILLAQGTAVPVKVAGSGATLVDSPGVEVPATRAVAAVVKREHPMRVRGQVLDPDGRPVAGARVTVPGPENWNHRLVRSVAASMVSGADGRYEIAFDQSDVSAFSDGTGGSSADEWKTACVIASAEGFGMAWKEWDHVDEKGDVELKLVKDDLPIQGRILDSTGKGAAGVVVVVDTLDAVADQAILEKEWSAGGGMAEIEVNCPLSSSGRNEVVVTDAEGRFRIVGLGRDRHVFMQIHGSSVGYERIEAITRVMEPVTRTVPQPIGTSPTFVTYGATFTIHASAAVAVEGTVHDAAGHAMGGVLVESKQFAGPFQGMDPEGLISCVTDSGGHYHLEGFPEGKGNVLLAVPNDDQPYFMQGSKLDDVKGKTVADFELHKGVWITGRVTDKVTGKPLAARIYYTTYLDNEHTFDLPEFVVREAGYGTMQGNQLRNETKDDGSYRVVAVPGRGFVSAEDYTGKYLTGVGLGEVEALMNKSHRIVGVYDPFPPPLSTNGTVEVDVPEQGESVTVNMQMDPGMTAWVNLVDAGGKEVSGCFVRGDTAEVYYGWYGHTISGASFEAVGLGAGKKRAVLALNDARGIGKVVVFDPSELKEGKLTVKLEALAEVSGRCVDSEGKGLAGVELLAEAGTFMRSVTTDENGGFKYPVVTGGACDILVSAGPYVGSVVADNVLLQPGEKKSIGDVELRLMKDQ